MRRTPRSFRGKGRRGRGKPGSLASLCFPDTACSTDRRCVARLQSHFSKGVPRFVSLRPVLVMLAVDPTFSFLPFVTRISAWFAFTDPFEGGQHL